jgi:hypothetical protein
VSEGATMSEGAGCTAKYYQYSPFALQPALLNM